MEEFSFTPVNYCSSYILGSYLKVFAIRTAVSSLTSRSRTPINEGRGQPNQKTLANGTGPPNGLVEIARVDRFIDTNYNCNVRPFTDNNGC